MPAHRSLTVFRCDHFELPLPDGHRFPIDKYAKLRARLVAEGVLTADDLRIPDAVTTRQLALAHDPDYVERVVTGSLSPREVRALGFPWSLGLVERSRRSVGGTLGACRAALEHGLAANLAGGTHHAFRDRGEGFCVFNDTVVAVRVLQAEGAVRSAIVLDCDVHQGNGTAALVAEDPTVFTFSIHGANNYPLQKERSDLDVALPDGTADEPYLAALAAGLDEAFDRARPDLAVYLAGADPFSGDRLGRLALSKGGLADRDELVLERCRREGVPVAITLAGGYAEPVEDTVDIHVRTILTAARRVRTGL